MELTGEIFVPANRSEVFTAIRDPQVMVGCIDGVSDLEQIDASHFRALMQTRVGFIQLKFKVDVELLDEVANERVRLQIQGRSIGLIGRLRATSSTELSDTVGGTLVTYRTELVFTGKLGSIGQAAVKAKSGELEARFATNLAAVLSP